jgi:hypothetical protein
VTPDKRPPSKRRKKDGRVLSARTGPNAGDHYEIVYFKRQKKDDPTQPMPGQEYLNSCPTSIRAQMRAVLVAVAAAPPPQFTGGGKWEAMHGSMTGYFEVRIDGPGRTHYRLFCRLDTTAENHGPLLVIIDGATKPFRTEMPESVYRRVRRYGEEYLANRGRANG